MILGKQTVFLVLTFLVMVAIILLSKDVTTALLLVSLLTNFLIISSQLTLISERHEAGLEGKTSSAGENVMPGAFPWITGASGDGFVDESENPSNVIEDVDNFASEPVWAEAHDQGAYPGGLDDIIAKGASAAAYDYSLEGGPFGSGHVCQPVDANGPHFPGDPYHLNTLQTRGTRPANSGCDSGPNSESRNTFDADRTTVEHARWRHDPYRVVAGIMCKKDLIAKHFSEELAQEEHGPWWGRADV